MADHHIGAYNPELRGLVGGHPHPALLPHPRHPGIYRRQGLLYAQEGRRLTGRARIR